MKQVNDLISQLREKIKVYFEKDASGHNVDHLERTLNYALYLQSKEGGDLVVVALSAYIHDIHRILSVERERFVSPKESLPVCESFLKGLNITEKQKQHILHAIEHHEEYAFGKDKIQIDDIESKILQDADNLDAIGAIGIVRTLKYGIARNRLVYDPTVPLYQNDYTESKEDISTIHHIYNKLLRLGEYMNTKTARQLAEKKTQLMKDFIEMYIKETTGNFDI
ncbi:MAG: HD domain-containing protein [Clostridia bacterium]|nr:HD domain-containing protein [Clostridia bacterium]